MIRLLTDVGDIRVEKGRRVSFSGVAALADADGLSTTDLPSTLVTVLMARAVDGARKESMPGSRHTEKDCESTTRTKHRKRLIAE